ncbi:hypothetical protein HAZT_HAZT008224 [Hyalella azteca]|uniref:carbonyl reductase (NADPH) n=1 Tax=Hyalella azteca TaxID=294128 RepID=A0A6A0HGV8_HYAAZ|nr:carbonyl reductase [NADPH] 3-like [Hyalella azteca]KAA0203607.1 hypothetical protein HAZT_HAZT008224 [Hyalella azteca]
MSTPRIFVVTGANKGIGLATVKALCEAVGSESIVYLTARSVERGTKAVQDLAKSGLKPRFHPVDVDDASSIETFATFLKKEHGGLDVLVNNAAIAYRDDAPEPIEVQAEHTVRVNYFGLRAVCNALFPLLRPHARVVNVSSAVGHLSWVNGEELRRQLADPALTVEQLDNIMRDFVKAVAENKHVQLGWRDVKYRPYMASKVGVSALTRIQQRMLDQDPREDIVVNHCHPGYVKTDMTANTGVFTAERGAVCPTYLALLPPNVASPRGEYVWHDKMVLDWVNADLPHPGY